MKFTKLIIGISICLTLLPGKTWAVNLLSAQQLKKVAVSAKGNGGFNGECVQVTVKNLTQQKQTVEVSPGLIFTDKDDAAQNLMVVSEYQLALMPGVSKSLNVYTMCIELHDMSPAKDDIFTLTGEASGHLLALAGFIADKKFQSSTAQSAVWALTDNADIYDIYASDTSLAGQLATFISKATGKPRPKLIVPKEHYIYSIRMSMTHHFDKPTKVTLACYDSAGTLVKEYYKDRLVQVGMYIANFGINRVAEKGTKYVFKLKDEKGKVIKERIITESVNEPKADKWHLTVSFDYMLDKPVNGATMSLYDDKGMLMENLYTNRNLPAGGRKQAYNFYHAYGQNTIFYLRLKDASGKVVMEHKIGSSKSIKIPY